MKEAERRGVIHFTGDMGAKEHSKKAFITVTGHWLTPQGEMKRQILGTESFDDLVAAEIEYEKSEGMQVTEEAEVPEFADDEDESSSF